MKLNQFLFSSLLIWLGGLQAQTTAMNQDSAMNEFVELAKKIEVGEIRHAATTQNGRIKPMATLAKEVMLFLTGKYKWKGLDPVQAYLGIAAFESSVYSPLIEVRGVELRKRLGFPKDKRYFSLADLENSQLQNLSMPLLQKEQEGGKLNEDDKKITEAFSQMNLFRQLATQQHLFGSVDFSWLEKGEPDPNSEIIPLAKNLIEALKSRDFASAATIAKDLREKTKNQKTPELFQHSLSKLELEVLYFDIRPFLWAGLIGILGGLALLIDSVRSRFSAKMIYSLFAISSLPIILGLAIRVYITQFAPITNMYGTMIWVAFGVNLFSLLLYYLYKNEVMCGFMLLGAGFILFLTENIPLILSPDMDPIVAVLRSNFWLSTHVTTITISYAAFTIAMILGNVTLIKVLIGKHSDKQIQDFYHYAYRMVQLGCFLLTVGIILGGVWADYSWGRFWGWDPKETWALIADLGFLVLLHARYIGWVTPFSFLAFLPLSYLLVVMAWYGVNFILAAGLHSYGFSSGGATAVAVFVGAQLLLIFAALAKLKFKLNRLEK